jgi:hypothetical protein
MLQAYWLVPVLRVTHSLEIFADEMVYVGALSIFQIRNLLSLRDWTERARNWTTGKKIWDTTLSFLIPTVILVVIFSQIKAFFGYRFNLTHQLLNMSRMSSDITILMIIGSVPDYVQRFVKLYWLLNDKTAGRQPVFRWGTQP